jgi:eukaryotic-like serine/threonine-protein kinase
MAEGLIGKELLGQFRVIERVGRGGMGEVYKAEQPAMDRMVAIKILHAKLARRPDLVSRFRREARAMSRLSHPNSARVFLYGQLEETNQLYIVMEYLDGVDLARLVRRDGPVEIHRAIRILIQVLGALEEAHSVGVIHRDLKPENILLTQQGGLKDFPKVLDFGLAKIQESKPRPGSMVLTREGMVFGTPEFMSPEQARGEILDARSDVYSVALIFYELTTGKLPFPRSKPMEYISHHINTEPIPIGQRNPSLSLPEALNAIVGRALEKNRDKRYQSAREFSDALRTVLPPSMQDITQQTSIVKKSSAAATKPMTRPRVEKSPPQNRIAGKGVLIALVAIIVVLVGVVIFLIATRDKPTPANVPLNTQLPLQSSYPASDQNATSSQGQLRPLQ